MDEKAALNVFDSIKRKWIISTWVTHILIACTIAGGFVFLGSHFFSLPIYWFIPAVLTVAVLLIYTDRSWRINDNDVASYLDRTYPQLEESSRLLLQPSGSLPLLQQLQADKTKQFIRAINQPAPFNRKILTACFLLPVITLACYGISFMPPYTSGNVTEDQPDKQNLIGKTARISPAISSFELRINPPAYTRKPLRVQKEGAVRAEVGSILNWIIKTNVPVKTTVLILNDMKTVSLTRSNDDSSQWQVSMPLNSSGFYQIRADSTASQLFQLEVIKDQPPKIQVRSPEPDLLVKYGASQKFSILSVISDDYGIRDAFISTTISRGSGEAVKFVQKNVPFSNSFSAQLTGYTLNQLIDLNTLSMQPGDELYFYIIAKDNHQQETKSDVFRVILEDTTQLFSMDGLMNGIAIKPEYFRSQRQIIIETEQLIRDKAKLTEEEFRNKSNNLGIDQKLLRLRYGKFLGEESVTYGQGEEEQHNEGEEHEEHKEPVNQDNPPDVLSQFGHSHDNAEDASYFDPATKAQLRATLNEMWKAELQLRTFKPKDALPFEYEALRLLKDLQQKSRVYVAKTNLKTTPLKSESRLTGELKEIIQPVFKYSLNFIPDLSEPVRQSLSDLQELKYLAIYTTETLSRLQESHQVLAQKAMVEPGKYVQALGALRRIISALKANGNVLTTDIVLVETAFQQMLEKPLPLPVVKQYTRNSLADEYFNNLKNSRNR